MALLPAEEHDAARGVTRPAEHGAQPAVADALADAIRGPCIAARRGAEHHRVDPRVLGQRVLQQRELVAVDLAAQVQLVAGDAKLHRLGRAHGPGDHDGEDEAVYCLAAAFLALPPGAPSCGQ